MASAFNTILPPNSGGCTAWSAGDANTRTIMPPSSYHTGGVNVGFGDGSVRFVSETINSRTTGGVDHCVLNGPSPFGVWGALGSTSGGESASF